MLDVELPTSQIKGELLYRYEQFINMDHLILPYVKKTEQPPTNTELQIAI